MKYEENTSALSKSIVIIPEYLLNSYCFNPVSNPVYLGKQACIASGQESDMNLANVATKSVLLYITLQFNFKTCKKNDNDFKLEQGENNV